MIENRNKEKKSKKKTEFQNSLIIVVFKFGAIYFAVFLKFSDLSLKESFKPNLVNFRLRFGSMKVKHLRYSIDIIYLIILI
jgi:hypothetical protein